MDIGWTIFVSKACSARAAVQIWIPSESIYVEGLSQTNGDLCLYNETSEYSK